MTYLAIMRWDEDGTPVCIQEFEKQEDAQAHVDQFAERCPDAFVAPKPAGRDEEWSVKDGRLEFSSERSAAYKEMWEKFNQGYAEAENEKSLVDVLIEKKIITKDDLAKVSQDINQKGS